MEGKSIAGGAARALAEQEIKKSWTGIWGNCDLFLHHVGPPGSVSKNDTNCSLNSFMKYRTLQC